MYIYIYIYIYILSYLYICVYIYIYSFLYILAAMLTKVRVTSIISQPGHQDSLATFHFLWRQICRKGSGASPYHHGLYMYIYIYIYIYMHTYNYIIYTYVHNMIYIYILYIYIYDYCIYVHPLQVGLSEMSEASHVPCPW